ncbi:DUF1553 domain-containing protein [Engelhardtia mirabilis]|uniref:Planctomycete cytochrome C n=1 Tax=Engelhardtia mirabilis TaxID=2528011 RepID=A0A518BNN0_9BACT|nr:hypothetical protein Pla133_36800 [Planctomycetes bacterium Pla133]QDV02906.1 hypothetical protein Pla86_36780 [Planctomycetes bacterium Pla86]
MVSTESLVNDYVVLPGDADQSLLIEAVRRSTKDLAMPPDYALDREEVSVLERWVNDGAPWPTESVGTKVGAANIPTPRAFRPIEPVAPPSDTTAGADAHPIDAFVTSALDSAGLVPGPPADPRELVRRLYFDLTGLPPTIEAVERFAADPSDDAYAALVNELLARPAHGERMARQWLDVVRYAESNGFERDGDKPHAWRYRDWVVGAFNEDLSYDAFLTAQLAGDEQPEVARDAPIATGFWRLGEWDDEPNDPQQALFDELDDSLRTITEGMLGVTVGCARCHDHRFDPISQRDYFSFLDWFRNVEPYAEPQHELGSPVLTPVGATDEAIADWRADRAEQAERRRAEFDALLEPVHRRLLEEQLAGFDPAVAERARARFERALELPIEERRGYLLEQRLPNIDRVLHALTFLERQRAWVTLARIEEEGGLGDHEGDLRWALTVREREGEPLPTHLLRRGLASSPMERTRASTPGAIGLPAPAAPVDPSSSQGRRSLLASWITDHANPLTPRVWVNRIWQQHFGVGLVATPDDFGNTGTAASHPELLDWLASRFVEDGWSTKQLHRLIVTSDAYRRSSRSIDGRAEEIDPANSLLWRQRPRRLEAEMVSDSMLFASGELVTTLGGPSVHPRMPREVLAGQSRPGRGWAPPEHDAERRRALYVRVQRGLIDPLSQLFDRPLPTLPSGTRSVTNTAPQALHLLNGEFAGSRAYALAERVAREAGPRVEDQVVRAFELALSRRPDNVELEAGVDHLRRIALEVEGQSRSLRFEPRVPERIDNQYFEQAEGADLLAAPGGPWRSAAGQWGEPYNGTLAADRERGPRAVLEGELGSDFRFEGTLHFDRGTAGADLILRATDQAAAGGVIVSLDLAHGRLIVLEQATETRMVALFAGLPIAADSLPVELALNGDRLTIVVGPQEAGPLVVEGLTQLQPGSFAVATVKEGLEFSGATLTIDGRSVDLLPPALSSERTALESLCLVLLNSNEFLWLD